MTSRTRRWGWAIAVLGLMAGPGSRSEAGLVIGSTVGGSLDTTGGTAFAGAATVGPGREFQAFVRPDTFGNNYRAYADLGVSTIRVGFEYLGGGTASSLVYTGDSTFTFTDILLAPGEAIVGLSLLEDDRNLNFGTSYTFTADSISIVFDGFAVSGNPTSSDRDDAIAYTILTGPAVAPVPEPSTLALAGTGALAGLGARWRKRPKVEPAA